jgi:hypothetical protein
LISGSELLIHVLTEISPFIPIGRTRTTSLLRVVGNSTARAIIGALVEAFSIVPIRNIGERIAVRGGEIPDTLDLDRSIGDEVETSVEAEVVSVGWSYKHSALLKPVVRPLFAAKPPSGAAEGKESE